MIRALGERACRIAQRIFPDPFVFAIVLTFVTFGLALLLTDRRPLELVDAWVGKLDPSGDAGFFGNWILMFTAQMGLMLVAGHAIATAPIVARAISALARRPRSAGGAAALVATGAIVASYLNWALGLIFGALLAREVGYEGRRRGVKIHYPLVGAAGFVGLMVWHGGLSGSAPLKVTNYADVQGLLKEPLASRVGAIPLDRTLGSALNLVVCGALLLIVPLFFYLLAPRREEDAQELDAELAKAVEAERRAEHEPPPGPLTFARRLDESRLLAIAMAAVGVAASWLFCARGGLRKLDPNAVNLILVTVGLLLHGTPGRYVRAVDRAARGCGGIVLQFPFYAGIWGIMQGSGLVSIFSDWVTRTATPQTFPFLAFLSAGIVNNFIPSGGGQWAVQGPILATAAANLGVPVEQAVLSLAYGDEWTNMLQPFWALPLLGITGLRAGDIMGYTMVVMVLSFPIYAIPLLLF